MPEGITEHVIDLPGGPVHYYRAGDAGPAVVLLHGGGTDTAWISWKKCIPRLSGRYRVFAPDWPGHGGSKKYRGRATQEMLEGCLGELLDAWGLPHATLVGLSMGASVAAGFTIRDAGNGRIDRLVLADSGGLADRTDMQLLTYLMLHMPFMPRMMSLMFLNRNLIRYSLAGQLFKSDVADIDEIVEDIYMELKERGSIYSDWQIDEAGPTRLKTCHMPMLHMIRCPAMVIHGVLDSVVPVRYARQAAEEIPDCSLVLIDGCGHWPNREKADEFNRALESFLDRTGGIKTG